MQHFIEKKVKFGLAYVKHYLNLLLLQSNVVVAGQHLLQDVRSGDGRGPRAGLPHPLHRGVPQKDAENGKQGHFPCEISQLCLMVWYPLAKEEG